LVSREFSATVQSWKPLNIPDIEDAMDDPDRIVCILASRPRREQPNDVLSTRKRDKDCLTPRPTLKWTDLRQKLGLTTSIHLNDA